jgi:hypothetical protein
MPNKRLYLCSMPNDEKAYSASGVLVRAPTSFLFALFGVKTDFQIAICFQYLVTMRPRQFVGQPMATRAAVLGTFFISALIIHKLRLIFR